MQRRPSKQSALALASCLALAAPAMAAPSDFRVLDDDIAAPGEVNLELQSSAARPSAASSFGPGLVWQGLAEVAYGIHPQWEASLQLPVARVRGTWYGTGLNAEAQYIAPHDDDDGGYWGGRAEIAYSSPVHEARTWQAEARLIAGYRAGHWHLLLNPGFTVPLSGEDRRVSFDSSGKLAYTLADRQAVGMEYFIDAGPVSNPLPRSRRSELALLVLDTRIGESAINVGIGRHMTQASDRWVVKLVVSLK